MYKESHEILATFAFSEKFLSDVKRSFFQGFIFLEFIAICFNSSVRKLQVNNHYFLAYTLS